MDDFASDTDSDYTSYWRDWVSAFDVLHLHDGTLGVVRDRLVKLAAGSGYRRESRGRLGLCRMAQARS